LSRLTTSRIWLFTTLVVVTTGVGLVEGGLTHYDESHSLAQHLFRSGVHWLAGSVLFWGFEIFVIPSRYGVGIRRLHFLSAITVKSMITIANVVLVFLLGRVVFEGSLDLNFLTKPQFYRILALVFITIIVLQTVVQIIRIIGGRTLINFVLGKYHQPVREDTIFMFLDLVGSTALAEKLGDVGVQAMITRFFFDITEPIIEHGGEIHRYVGDQVVVIWPLRAGVANMRAVRCCFAINRLLNDKAPEYQRQFGTVPAYRIGLHGGPVVVSQCGDQKQEISYFGDTVNMAARIEQQCKALDCALLISAELLERITLSPEFQALSKGTVLLRGREHETELLTIVRAADSDGAMLENP